MAADGHWEYFIECVEDHVRTSCKRKSQDFKALWGQLGADARTKPSCCIVPRPLPPSPPFPPESQSKINGNSNLITDLQSELCDFTSHCARQTSHDNNRHLTNHLAGGDGVHHCSGAVSQRGKRATVAGEGARCNTRMT